MARCRCSCLPRAHERGEGCLSPESLVKEAAARVREKISKAVASNVTVLDRDDGEALAPNQLLHQMLAEVDDIEVLAVAWRTPSGLWLTDFSKAKPGELLEAATALKLDAEVAWAEIQEQAEDDNSA